MAEAALDSAEAWDSMSDALLETSSETVPGAVQKLKVLCNAKWEELKTKLEHLSSVETRELPEEAGQREVKILQEQERRLKAEIEVLINLKPQCLPQDPEVIGEVLRLDLSKSISQLLETASLVQSQVKELDDCIAVEHEFTQQLQSIHQCLQERVDAGAEAPGEDEEEDTLEALMLEFDNKIKRAEKMNKELMKKLINFVTEHFPLPTEADLNQTRKKLRRSQAPRPDMLPLTAILQELMNKCIDEPNDPYVTITDRHWQAYIELLLRCNIALLHPSNDHCIKLVPFHL